MKTYDTVVHDTQSRMPILCSTFTIVLVLIVLEKYDFVLETSLKSPWILFVAYCKNLAIFTGDAAILPRKRW